MPVNPSDIEKTAFCAPAGKFEYVFMPFGVQNSPATFQHLMDQVLVNMMDFTRAYIDDVVVYSESWEEHLTPSDCTRTILGGRADGQAFQM